MFFPVPNIESKFMADVKNLFLSILPDKAMLKVNHVTPYGYKVRKKIMFAPLFKHIGPFSKLLLFDSILKKKYRYKLYIEKI